MEAQHARAISRIGRYLSSHGGNQVEIHENGVDAHPILGLQYLCLTEEEKGITLRRVQVAPKTPDHHHSPFHFVDAGDPQRLLTEHHGVWEFPHQEFQKIVTGPLAPRIVN